MDIRHDGSRVLVVQMQELLAKYYLEDARAIGRILANGHRIDFGDTDYKLVELPGVCSIMFMKKPHPPNTVAFNDPTNKWMFEEVPIPLVNQLGLGLIKVANELDNWLTNEVNLARKREDWKLIEELVSRRKTVDRKNPIFQKNIKILTTAIFGTPRLSFEQIRRVL